MPLILPDNLISEEDLKKNRIFTMESDRAISQEIRPIKIAIVNLMPKKEETELQFLRMLSNTALQIQVDFIRMETYTPTNASQEYLEKFYKTYSDIKDEKYDAMIITGAPVEGLDFKNIKYWEELEEIFEYAKTNVYSTMFVCWAAQAALYYYYGIERQSAGKKIFGIYPEEKLVDDKLLQGFDDEFYIPQSRYNCIGREVLDSHEDIKVVASRDDIGVSLARSNDNRFVFSFGHWEYDADTLHKEYLRDLKRGLATDLPYNYYRNDNPEDKILVKWRSAGNLFFSNWLNYCVYQETPFDIEKIQSKKVSKFGGSSLADANQFNRVRDIIHSEEDRKLVVVSAPGKRYDEDIKVTDVLIDINKIKTENGDLEKLIKRLERELEVGQEKLEANLETFQTRFEDIVRSLRLGEDLLEDLGGVREEIKRSKNEDFVLSRGEYLNARIMAEFLDYKFVDSKDLIFFDSYGELDEEKTYASIKDLLEDEEKVVVPGFYGSGSDGQIKTFERGGSDITGSLLASALNSAVYENWTDVSGVMTADPRLDASATTIPNLSYQELLEIGLGGAGVYQVDAIKPVMDKNIPIEILNTNEPASTGTRVENRGDDKDDKKD